MKARILALAAAVIIARVAGAQSADSSCTYTRCGLGLNPTLVGLDVVRGTANARVASLNFFWPSDVSRPFAGSDSAIVFAQRALESRRTASVLTDVGIALFAVAAGKIANDRVVHRGSAAWFAGGAALFAVSFPLQLRADGELSRAVWWYNSIFHR